MIFKKRGKNPVFLLSFLFFSHCGLKIGEKAPSTPTHAASLQAAYCSQLDYKEEFHSYFLHEQTENLKDNSSGQRLSKALDCFILTTERIKELFEHEHFEKQQLFNMLNHDLIYTQSNQSLIDHITNPAYFDTYIFIKDALIYLIAEQQTSRLIEADKICKAQNDKFVLSKQEVGVFTDFLKNLSEFFLKVEKDSYEVFNDFFRSKNILLKSQLEESDDLKKDFISFLSGYLSKDFPGYSSFLDKHLELEIQREQSKEQDLQPSFTFPNLPDFSETRQRRLKIKQENLEIKIWDKILQSLLDMIQLPPSSSETLTVQNVKYMMLNIYIVQTLFSVYDSNQNSELEPQELKSWPCLITPLISIFLPEILSEKLGKWNVEWESVQGIVDYFRDETQDAVENIYSPENMIPYIINYQDIPGPNFFYLNYALFSSKDLTALYYSDVSRLISVLFLEFFNQEEKKE